MHAIVDIVLPVFGVILLGFLSGRFRVLGEASSEALNRFVYYFAMPPLLFLSTAQVPVADVLNWPFIVAYLVGSAAALVVTLLGSRLLYGITEVHGLTIHGLSGAFSNTGYMGIPLFLAAFGPGKALPAVIVTMFATLIAIGGAIVALETITRPRAASRGVLRDFVRTLMRNPILIAPFAGLLWAALHLPLPSPLGHFLELIGAAAAPTALFAIGLSLCSYSLAGGFGQVAWLTVAKLVLHPFAVWLCVTYLFALDPFWADSAVILAALPVGTLVFIVSQRFDVKVVTSSAAIIATTALSVLTLSILLFWLRVG